MSSNGTRKRLLARLEDLEARAVGADPFRDFPDWSIEDQVEEVRDALRLHRIASTAQLATDRQIHLMGLLCAREELPGGEGEHRFPSGVVVSWSNNGDETWKVSASGYVSIEDLPEGVREHFKRMDPVEQPERERWLYADRHRAREHRERMRRWEAAGAFDPKGPGEGRSYWPDAPS